MDYVTHVNMSLNILFVLYTFYIHFTVHTNAYTVHFTVVYYCLHTIVDFTTVHYFKYTTVYVASTYCILHLCTMFVKALCMFCQNKPKTVYKTHKFVKAQSKQTLQRIHHKNFEFPSELVMVQP